MKPPYSGTSKKINQREIAHELGVSQSLVSKILSGRKEASPETTEKILKVAKRQGYRPNMLVRGLQTGETKTVGVIIPANTFLSEVVHGIHDALDRAGYAMILVWNTENIAEPDSKTELQYIHRLVDRRVDGVILRPTHDDATDMYFSEIAERGIPLVVVDRLLARTKYDFAGTDDIAGAEMAARHLLDLGHRRLGQLAGPSSVSTSRDRRIGFEKAIAEFGQGATCRTIEAVDFQNVEKDITELLLSKPRPTAVFGANDHTAKEIYQVAARLGLRIPQDLSVVGFADLNFAAWMFPPLTTVRQDPYGIGEAAANLVLARCRGKVNSAKQETIRLTPELVIRESTAKHGV
ncbi:MAG: hypothetical protein A2283_10520 [Lentisphaerae bacterium RIFOXYA12_FULL_48_11]|nr:MAG: hypothetical protein A2283_10520 [Lentisphaerae bacterium RIFOXYA12_FULL_48_11]